MKHEMRSFYSLSLLLLFIVNTIGGICILRFHHHHIKEYIESILRNGNLQIHLTEIVISDNESDQLIWLKENFEFRYKGKMYDVICTEHKKDTTIYFCLNDKTEEGLIREFAINGNHPFPGQHPDSAIVLQFFKIIYEIILIPSLTSDLVMTETPKINFGQLHTYHPIYLTLSGEPPDFA
ncbi:MAG: hypothetical protein H7X99_00865 [Saprospiraceae bacterium]|nr:hypothetical protein [Saprospiraceae bacterium]